MSEVIEPPSSALATIDTINTALVFAPGGAESLLARIEREAREQAKKLDISTPRGRDEIKSLAYKVARSKTALDSAGKDLKAEWLAKSNAVDAERRAIRERLDALAEEVRKPVTDWEDAEKARIKRNEDAIAALEALTIGLDTMTTDQIAERYQVCGDFIPAHWGLDFVAKAERIHAGVKAQLRVARQEAKVREDEAAAEAQRQAEEAARLQAERDARIAAEAAEAARKEAEAKAEREAADAARRAAAEKAEVERKAREALEAAERDRLAAEQKAQQERDAAAKREREAVEAAKRAEAARIAAEQKAEQDRIAAAEAADRDRAAAVAAERRRQEAETKRQAEEDARRAADVAHRKRVNNEVLHALIEAMGDMHSGSAGEANKIGVEIIKAIVSGKVPHTSIRY